MELFIITGLSGAGKSMAVKIFENSGYYCVDNIPPRIIPIITDIGQNVDSSSAKKVAVVVDARSREMWGDLTMALERIERSHIKHTIIFFDASTDVLFSRYRETRNRHPLIDDNFSDAKDLREAIEMERELLAELRGKAHIIIDTSATGPPELRKRIMNILDRRKDKQMSITCVSFGYRNGLPPEADLVFDVRCLPNPYYVSELREHTGEETCVRDYIMQYPQSVVFIEKLKDLLGFSVPLYVEEGKSQLVIAIGCTGGKHRSVATAEELCRFLRDKGYSTGVVHRDKNKSSNR